MSQKSSFSVDICILNSSAKKVAVPKGKYLFYFFSYFILR